MSLSLKWISIKYRKLILKGHSIINVDYFFFLKASDVSSEVGITSVPSFVMYSGEKVVCQLPGPNAEQLQAAVKSFK